ncbi:hypothetical protein CesoFtcFv8_007522 [Champsocephalus esox]|uniref:Uncharacterized protein n=2 Tax=Champsocephalus TaxID=52236 RepID=A0AAN8HTE3_CHAGU|nr:hypothetical protein CesoFtcFv8_007522 [Champsocephalus esox]KAK5928024.1 hypothetical protein CgunFtcFv8_013123 [Champsocephalus gunnari]
MCLTRRLSPPRLYLCASEKFHGGGGKTNAPRTNTQPVGLSLGEHTMTKKGPAVIASPCLMWSDDGSPLARR